MLKIFPMTVFPKYLSNPNLLLKLSNPFHYVKYIFNIYCFIVLNERCPPFILPKSAKILILGSGPSLDKISQLNLQSYDAIIAINHAVFCEKLNNVREKLYWISGDHGRLNELRSSLLELQIKQCLYGCHFPYKIREVSKICFEDGITMLKTQIPLINLLKVILDDEAPPYPKNCDEIEAIVTSYLTDFDSGLPCLGQSTLLSIILLSSKSCNHIDLLGCDMSDGRSSFSSIKVAGSSSLSSTNLKTRYFVLLKILKKYQVTVTNLSWRITSEKD